MEDKCEAVRSGTKEYGRGPRSFWERQFRNGDSYDVECFYGLNNPYVTVEA
jgi:hypothetical protein